MKKGFHFLAASTLVMSGAVCFARTSTAQEARAGAGAKVQTNLGEKSQVTPGSMATGTAIHAELDKSLDSKKAKVGDPVTARTTEAVKEDGKVVLRRGTKLTGRVTRASARSKGDNDSTLALQFDRAELKGGQEVALQVNVQAIAAAPGVAPIGGDDLQGMGSAGAPAGPGANRGGLAAPVGGAVSGAASTTARTTESAAGAVNSTVNSTTNAAAGVGGAADQGVSGGLTSSGQLAANSRGAFGLSGLSLGADASNTTQGSVIASSGKSVRLDNGTRLLLVAQANTSASAQR